MRKKLPNPLLMPNEVLPPHCDANLPSSRAQAYSASNVSSVDTARISNHSTRTPSTTTIFSTPPHRPAANISHHEGQYAPAAVYATECPCPFVYNKQHKLTLWWWTQIGKPRPSALELPPPDHVSLLTNLGCLSGDRDRVGECTSFAAFEPLSLGLDPS